MSQLPMYPGKINSPAATLAVTLSAAGTTAQLNTGDGEKFPDAPNIAVIGKGPNAETVLYGSKSGDNLTDLTRAFQGTAAEWTPGTEVSRLLTAYDWDSIRQNHETHLAEITSQSLVITRDLTLTGLQTITTTKRIKSVFANGAVFNTRKTFHGFSSGVNNFCIYQDGTSGTFYQASAFITVTDSGTTNRTVGAVANITNTSFDINWTKAGTGATGTIAINLIILFHGEG